MKIYYVDLLVQKSKAKPNFYGPEEIKTAKRRFPLRRLMKVLGDEEYIRTHQRKSPFHSTNERGLAVFQCNSRWVFTCCGQHGIRGDQIDYVKAKYDLTTGQAISFLCELHHYGRES
jgi:hypothetical protein